MNKNVTFEPTADEAAQIESVVKDLLSQIKRANEEMEKDQQEIEILKAQTRAVLSKLQTA